MPVTGLWRHHDGAPEPPLRLDDVRFDLEDGTLRYPHTRESAPESALVGYLDEARRLFADREAMATTRTDSGASGLSADFEALRWFELPSSSVAG